MPNYPWRFSRFIRLWRMAKKSRRPRVAYAVESFIHGRNPSLFFQNLTASLEPGDRLILCDDFLTQRGREILAGTTTDRRRMRHLQEHRLGWHAQNRLTHGELLELVVKHGFRERKVQDLTPYLELDRIRDIIIRIVVSLGRGLPIRHSAWENMLGGNALQLCLKGELLSYLYISLEKS